MFAQFPLKYSHTNIAKLWQNAWDSVSQMVRGLCCAPHSQLCSWGIWPNWRYPCSIVTTHLENSQFLSREAQNSRPEPGVGEAAVKNTFLLMAWITH